MHLNVARGCAPTARILTGLLEAERVRIEPANAARAVVCWGAGGRFDHPVLNDRCSAYNKWEQLQVLTRAGIPVPQHVLTPPAAQNMYPMFARSMHHVGGTDIRICLQQEDARRFAGADRFFTKWEPSTAEYRVWIYRRQHLGTYRKMLRRPNEVRGYGRNYNNGYTFELVPADGVPRDAVDIAQRSVTALELDFGAVDMLQKPDGTFMVLEVNTAPGVEGPDRQVIQALARKIARWQQLNFPARQGTRARCR